MDLGKVTNLVRQLAPTLASALGGPLAGIAVQTLSEAVLGKPDGDLPDVAAALANATPEQIASLKKADAEFKIRMKELDVDLDRIAFEDRADARAREAAVGDLTPRILAAAITVGFFSVLLFLMHRGLPKEGGDALLLLIGSLATAWTAIITYYFGSSAGSAAKSIMIDRLKR